MGAWSHDSLVQILSEHICEVVFYARGDGQPRRMLCTNSKLLLNSIAGKTALGFEPPKGTGLKYIPAQKGLVVTWDVMWQNYRQIPIDSANVISAIPLRTEQEVDNFWLYFDKKLQKMGGMEKNSYMRK